ncbi:MAG: hypothetical protein QGF00_27730 [Planctomycetota bacterium]|jgi:hypothetical protein|nr:hypothetical protein [Planctomycetota bacterium]MDP7253420.1 hypothetical protein [Planctomycetota bacterium]
MGEETIRGLEQAGVLEQEGIAWRMKWPPVFGRNQMLQATT